MGRGCGWSISLVSFHEIQVAKPRSSCRAGHADRNTRAAQLGLAATEFERAEPFTRIGGGIVITGKRVALCWSGWVA